MEIRVIDSPEPLSPQARYSGSLLAVSEVYNKLFSELGKYTSGTIGGGSVLISGHRGSGKTTLVHKAIQDLIREYSDAQVLSRPLLVPLHGPNLLKLTNDVDTSLENDGGDSNERRPPKGGKTKIEILTENALEEIVLSLYRALTNEFGESFTNKVGEIPNLELAELAGQFQIEMDEASDVAILRQFWKKVGALQSGILFEQREGSEKLANQGINELLALSSAAQAFRMMSGKIEESNTQSSSSDKETTTTNKYEFNLKDIADGFMGVFTGLASGFAAYELSEDSALVAGIAAIIGAFLGKMTMGQTSIATRKKAMKREYSFIRDRSVSVLDRELPVLINRVRTAGLAPIFVIDELDKVLPPYEDFGDLIGHLKHFVSERSFFIFITDRNYFEHITQLSRNRTYAKEYTYFTHRFFNYYRPSDLHEYLGRKFRVKNEEDRNEAKLLNYLLLYRARLHPIDLKREIRKITHDDTITLPSGELRSRIAYRFHIMIQLAIEATIESNDLKDRFGQDSYFSQLAYDALYYPSRQWANGDRYLDIRKHTFFKFLWRRTQLDLTAEAEKQLITDIKEKEWAKVEEVLPFAIHDGEFLYQKLLNLLGLISESQTLLDLIRENEIDIENEIVSTIPDSEQFQLIKVIDSEEKYEWQYDFYGRKLDRISYEMDRSKDVVAFLFELEDFLKSILNGIGLKDLAEANIVSSSPDWEEVQKVGKELMDEHTELAMEERDLHYDTVMEYHNNVKSVGGLMAKVIFLYGSVNQSSDQYRALSYIHMLTVYGQSFENLDAILSDELNLSLKDWNANYLLTPETFGNWKEKITNLNAAPVSISEAQNLAFESLWKERLQTFQVTGNLHFDFRLLDLLFLTNRPWYVDPKFSYVGVAYMSEMIVRYFQERTYSEDDFDEQHVLKWVLPLAFQQLGFGGLFQSLRVDFRAMIPAKIRPEFVKVLDEMEYYSLENFKSLDQGILIFQNIESEHVPGLRTSENIAGFAFDTDTLKSRTFFGRLFSLPLLTGHVNYILFDLKSDEQCTEVLESLPKSLSNIPYFKISSGRQSKSRFPIIEPLENLDDYWNTMNRLQSAKKQSARKK